MKAGTPLSVTSQQCLSDADQMRLVATVYRAGLNAGGDEVTAYFDALEAYKKLIPQALHPFATRRTAELLARAHETSPGWIARVPDQGPRSESRVRRFPA